MREVAFHLKLVPVDKVSISSMLSIHIFRTNVVLAVFFTYIRTYIHRKKAAKMTFVRNICAYNVDEIEHRKA